MGNSAGEELDARWHQKVKRVGLNFDMLEATVERMEREEKLKLKRIAFNRNGGAWRIILTAEVDGKRVVQFADVDEIGTSAGKLTNMLTQPVWKADKFATPAPSGVESSTAVLLTKAVKSAKLG